MLGAWSPTFMVLNPTLPNPKRCQQKFLEEGRSPFAPSVQVMEAVRKYEQLFLKPKTSVAVMNISYAQWEDQVKQSDLISIVDRHLKQLVTVWRWDI